MKLHWPAELREAIAWAAREEGQRGKPRPAEYVLRAIGAPAIIGHFPCRRRR